MRDITVWENVTRENKRKGFVTIMEARSAHALYHRTAEAPAGLVCQGHQKAGKKCSLTGKEVKDLIALVKDKITYTQ
eukprot:9882321-Ditylum_brightwellii.AAC.1